MIFSEDSAILRWSRHEAYIMQLYQNRVRISFKEVLDIIVEAGSQEELLLAIIRNEVASAEIANVVEDIYSKYPSREGLYEAPELTINGPKIDGEFHIQYSLNHDYLSNIDGDEYLRRCSLNS